MEIKRQGFVLVELLVALLLVVILSFVVIKTRVNCIENFFDIQNQYDAAQIAYEILDYASSVKSFSEAEIKKDCLIPEKFSFCYNKTPVMVFDNMFDHILVKIKWKNFFGKERFYEVQTVV